MNELIFLFHVIGIVSSLLIAMRWGKSALISLTALFAVVANIFVMKQITLFSLHVTASDALAVGSVLGIGLLQEYFGDKTAKKAISISFGLMFFFGMLSQIHLLYTPSGFDQTQSSFQMILGSTPRIIAASFFAFYVMQKCNVWVLHLLKKRLPKLHLSFRMALSGSVAQVIDTVLFGFLGLYGIVHSITHILLMSLCIKLISILISLPFTSFSKRFMKEAHEQV